MLLTTIREKPERSAPSKINMNKRLWALRLHIYTLFHPRISSGLRGGVTKHKEFLWKFDARGWYPKIQYQWK